MVRLALVISWGLVGFIQSIGSAQGADEQILFFHAEQCEPCRQMEPLLVQLQQQGWTVKSINAPAQLDLAKQFQIKNLPTLVVMNNNKEVDRVVGLIHRDQLQPRLDRTRARQQSSAISSLGPTAAPHLASGEKSLPGNFSAGPAKLSVQPIVRGQSDPITPGQSFPLLASNSRMQGSLGSVTERFIDPALEPAKGNSESAINGASRDTAVARATAATVRIKVEEANSLAHGTGTIVAVHNREALIMTCGHLFRDMVPGSKLSVDLFAGTPKQVNLPAQLIDFQAEQQDIALISTVLPVPVQPVPILPRSELIKVGQSVFSLGCDHGNTPSLRDTRITHVNRYLGAANVEIEGAPAVGRSGGGLFDSRGRLIGVCNAACNEENEGIYAGAEVIYQQLARVDHAHLFQPQSQAVQSQPEELRSPGETGLENRTYLASTSSPQDQVASNSSTGSPLWPDQDPRLTTTTELPEQNLQLMSSSHRQQSNAANTPTLICIVRDVNGKDQMISIAKPSPELLRLVKQQATSSP